MITACDNCDCLIDTDLQEHGWHNEGSIRFALCARCEEDYMLAQEHENHMRATTEAKQ